MTEYELKRLISRARFRTYYLDSSLKESITYDTVRNLCDELKKILRRHKDVTVVVIER